MANQSPILPIIAGNPDHAALIKTHAVLRLNQISSVSRIKHSQLSPTDERIHLHFTIRMANADEYTVSLKAVSKANHKAATEFLNEVRWNLVTLSICGFDVENVAIVGGFFGVEDEPVDPDPVPAVLDGSTFNVDDSDDDSDSVGVAA